MKPLPGLGPLETAVMAALWNRRSATVRELHGALGGDRVLAYTTTMTTMARLHRKGLLDRTPEGNAYRYSTRVDRGGWLRRWSKGAIDNLLPNLDEATVAYFVAEAQKVSPQVVDALRSALKDTKE